MSEGADAEGPIGAFLVKVIIERCRPEPGTSNSHSLDAFLYPSCGGCLLNPRRTNISFFSDPIMHAEMEMEGKEPATIRDVRLQPPEREVAGANQSLKRSAGERNVLPARERPTTLRIAGTSPKDHRFHLMVSFGQTGGDSPQVANAATIAIMRYDNSDSHSSFLTTSFCRLQRTLSLGNNVGKYIVDTSSRPPRNRREQFTDVSNLIRRLFV